MHLTMQLHTDFKIILFFNLFIGFSTGSCTYKAVGENVTIPLDYKGSKYELTWTQNQTKVYSHRDEKRRIEKFSIDQSGSLILTEIQTDKSGVYKGVVYNKNGQLQKETKVYLCVQEPVPKPTLIVTCNETGVSLSCSGIKHIKVSWEKNGIQMSNVKNTDLYLKSSEFKPGDKFSCLFSNEVSNSSSEVHPACSGTGPHPTEKGENEVTKKKENDTSKKTYIFGLDLWWMLVVVTGGACLLLILFIICIVCVCRCCRQSKRHAKEEQEYRLTSLMPDYTNRPDDGDDYEENQETASQRRSKSQRPLPPLPTPQGPHHGAPL